MSLLTGQIKSLGFLLKGSVLFLHHQASQLPSLLTFLLGFPANPSSMATAEAGAGSWKVLEAPCETGPKILQRSPSFTLAGLSESAAHPRVHIQPFLKSWPIVKPAFGFRETEWL